MLLIVNPFWSCGAVKQAFTLELVIEKEGFLQLKDNSSNFVLFKPEISLEVGQQDRHRVSPYSVQYVRYIGLLSTAVLSVFLYA